MRALNITLWIVGIALLSFLGYAGAGAPSPTLLRVQVEVIVVDQCTGENIDLNGELQVFSNLVVDGAGGFHDTFVVILARLSGVGMTSGIVYHAQLASHESINVTGNVLPLVGTLTQTVKLISQGNTANLVVSLSVHFTVVPTGETTADVIHVAGGCRG